MNKLLKFALKAYLAITLCVIVILCFAYPMHLREYVLYFSETRQSIFFPYEYFSQDLSEAQFKEKLKVVEFRCYDNTNHRDASMGQRSCFAGIKQFNGLPAMSLAAHFMNGKLNHAAIQSPWWTHGALMKQMQNSYGQAKGSSRAPNSNTAFVGWELPEGHGLFMDRFRPLNPLMWNTVLWTSQRACTESGCFSK